MLFRSHGRDGFVDAYFLFALQAVDRALEIQYEFPQAHNTRGMVLAKMSRLDEALEATEVALSQSPDYDKASENRDRIKELIWKRATIPDYHNEDTVNNLSIQDF